MVGEGIVVEVDEPCTAVVVVAVEEDDPEAVEELVVVAGAIVVVVLVEDDELHAESATAKTGMTAKLRDFFTTRSFR